MVQEGQDEYILLNQSKIKLCSLTLLIAHYSWCNSTAACFAFQKIFFVAYISLEIP